MRRGSFLRYPFHPIAASPHSASHGAMQRSKRGCRVDERSQTKDSQRGKNHQDLPVRQPRGHPRNRRDRPPGRRRGHGQRATAPWCWSPPWRPRPQREGQDFFPLTVDYQEKFYAGGRIPGGFFKREGRADREGNADLAPDRPSDPPAVPGRLQERSADHRHGDVAEPGSRRRHPGADRRLRRAGADRRPVPGPDRRRQGRLQGRPVPAEPDRQRAEGIRSSSWSSPAPRTPC